MNGHLVPRAALTAVCREAMYALMRTQFPDVAREDFTRDLEGKNWALLLEDESGRLVGFSTLYHGRSQFRGRDIQVLFSGDTVISEAFAGSSALSKNWLAAINRLRFDDGTPLHWLLIVSGYRTYRFLPVFLREFHPRHDTPIPGDARALMDQLARERYGDCYDAATGIVRFPHPQRLKDGLRGIPANRLADPHIAYFAARSPGHEDGDELVCLAEICRDNMTSAGLRMWELSSGLLAPSVAPS